MNYRIIQLITEADTHAWSVAEKYVAGDGCNDGEVNYLWEDAFREKFAELIVRDVTEQIITRERTDGEWYQTDIFKHFGVE